jgi:hypothetical protein
MTTGQRVGYFLNEWAVAIIGLCILSAVMVFYADKSDWRTPAWVVAFGIAWCVPFWLWKSFLVRRSIKRTSELTFQQQGLVSGDIQGLNNNLSQASSLSAQPTHAVSPVTYEAPKKSSGISLGWKIRLGFFGLFIVIGILDSQWKTVDKYFPQLNKVIHSGTPTSEGDMDYNIGHLQQDEQKLSEECPDNMKFKECRASILANKPSLADMHQRVQALVDAWAKEKSERSIPAECQRAMDGRLTAYNQYLRAEDKFFALLQSIDPDSLEGFKASKARLDEVSGEEDAAVNALRNNKVGNLCNGY